MKEIKDLRDLREINTNEIVELLDELRGIAAKRATEWLGQGRSQARRAIGAPGDGTLAIVFVGGIVLGAAVGAAVAMLMTPMSGFDARRRLGDQVDELRERSPLTPWTGNGRSAYERKIHEGVPDTAVGASEVPPS